MSRIARTILELSGQSPLRLVYGVMASATTVYIDGSTVVATVPKLASVGTLAASDYVAVLAVDADYLIIGKVA